MDDEEKWKIHEGPGRYFVNQNFQKNGVESQSGESTKTVKGMWVFVTLMFSLLAIGSIFILTGGSFLATIIPALICVFLLIYVIRKKVLDENKMKELLADNANSNEFGVEAFDNLISLDKETGLWSYQSSDDGLLSGYMVTFDYASILDESFSANQNLLENAMRPFFKQLHDNNLKFRKYDIAVHRKISKGTMDSIRRVGLLEENSWLQLVEMLQNEAMASLEQNSSDTYRQYFLILNSDFRNILNFREIVESIIKSTLATQTSIVRPKILDSEESIEFIVNYFNIASFDDENLVKNIKRMDVSRFIRFDAFYDINGTKYDLSDFDKTSSGKKKTMNTTLNDVSSQLNRNQNKKKKSVLSKEEREEQVRNRKKHIQKPGIDKQKKQQLDRKAEANTKKTMNKKLQDDKKRSMADLQKRNISKKQAVQRTNGTTLEDLLNQKRGDH